MFRDMDGWTLVFIVLAGVVGLVSSDKDVIKCQSGVIVGVKNCSREDKHTTTVEHKSNETANSKTNEKDTVFVVLITVPVIVFAAIFIGVIYACFSRKLYRKLHIPCIRNQDQVLQTEGLPLNSENNQGRV